jgi:hypothetical protein
VDPSRKMRMEAVTLRTSDAEATRPVTLTDAFKNLFKLEKDMAFKVLNRLGVDPSPAERSRILTVPTKNLQAFIAYCNGLDLEDKGQFQKAAAQYQKALQMDPQYKPAQQKLRSASILARATETGWRPSDSRPRAADRLVQPLINPESLMRDRLNTVQTNIGSNFIIGKDIRKAGEIPAVDITPPPEPPPEPPPVIPDLPQPPALPTIIP